jgi:MarR-like DNA-binding transcriptional regulator SgrR of sgrS sRNA
MRNGRNYYSFGVTLGKYTCGLIRCDDDDDVCSGHLLYHWKLTISFAVWHWHFILKETES